MNTNIGGYKMKTKRQIEQHSWGEIMTHQETVKECRRLCRALGLTFKRQDAPHHTGAVYQIVIRRKGIVLMHSLSLSTAYNNLCSGYVERLVFL